MSPNQGGPAILAFDVPDDIITWQQMSIFHSARALAKTKKPELYAAAYRSCPGTADRRLEIWLVPMSIGKLLPTLPLWIGPDHAVPLHLEQAYRRACKSSRIK